MLSDLLYRIRVLFKRKAVEGELDEELDSILNARWKSTCEPA